MIGASFKDQFLHQLDNEDLSLEDRLHVAYGALISSDFPVVGKEQIIIDWFGSCLKSNALRLKTILKSLLKCLRSEWLSTFSESINPSSILQAISELEVTYKDKHSKSLISGLMLILNNPGYQRYCRFEIDSMVQAVMLTFNVLSKAAQIKGVLNDSSGNVDTMVFVNSVLEELICSVSTHYKITQQRNELKQHFINSILTELFVFKFNFQQSSKFKDLLEEILFDQDLEVLCKAFKTNMTGRVPTHLKTLTMKLVENKNQYEIVHLNALLLDVCIQNTMKKGKRETSYLSLFYVLTSVAGFKLNLPYSTIVSSYDDSVRLSVLRELMLVLERHNVQASAETDQGVLSHFLVSIVKQLLSKEFTMSSNLLWAIQSIFKVSPESVKIMFPTCIEHVMFVKKDDSEVLAAYNHLMVDVIKTFSDLNQLEQFFSLFFKKAISLWKEKKIPELTLEMVFSSGFFSVLSEKFPSLTGNQLKALLGIFGNVFTKYFICEVEGNYCTDHSFVLLTHLIVDVICFMLESACIVLSSRWNIVKNELTNLVTAVGKFGIGVTKSTEPEFHLEFLKLVRVLADIELTMNQYVVSLSTTRILPTADSSKTSSSVTNLSKTHGFLSSSVWKQLFKRVEQSNDSRLAHCWNDLLVQKYLRTSEVEVITHLALTADSDWLWQTVSHVSRVMPVEYLEPYTERLLSNDVFAADDFSDKLAALRDINIVTNRTLRAAMDVQLLKQMSKALGSNRSLCRSMMKIVDFYPVVRYESDKGSTEELTSVTDALTEILRKCSGELEEITLSHESKDYIARLLMLMTELSPHCLKTATKRLVCSVLLGLSCDLRNEVSLLHSVLSLIIACMDDNSALIPESLNRGVLIYWLVTVVPASFPLRHELCNVVVSKVIYTLDQVSNVDDIYQVLKGDPDLLCTILETFIRVHGNKHFKEKGNHQQMFEGLISVAATIVLKKPKEKYLKLYTTALKAELLILKEQTPVLLQNMTAYLEILFKRFAEHSDVEPQATELIQLALASESKLESSTVTFINESVAKELCKTSSSPILRNPASIKSFLGSLQCDAFRKVLSDIYNFNKKMLESNSNNTFAISNVCELMNIVVTCQVDKDKSTVRHRMLVNILSDCQPLLGRDPASFHPVVLQLLHSICVSKSVPLDFKLLDLILVILGTAPTDSTPHLLPESLIVLNALIVVRSELVFDRIPVFLQRLRKFTKSLVLLASTGKESSLGYDSLATSSANQLTRIIKVITDHHPKHFARIAPYLIADFLYLLANHCLDTVIKSELQSCVCGLLTICDHYGTQQLQNLLPESSTEMYKTLSVIYHKSYKYTGKV